MSASMIYRADIGSIPTNPLGFEGHSPHVQSCRRHVRRCGRYFVGRSRRNAHLTQHRPENPQIFRCCPP